MEEHSTMVENSVTPAKCRSLYYEEEKVKTRNKYSPIQCALLNTMQAARSAVDKVQRDLSVRLQLLDVGTDPASMKWKQSTMDVRKQSVSSQLAAMIAAAAQVIKLTFGSSSEVDHPAVEEAVITIMKNLSEMSKDVKMIAILMDDDMHEDNLMDAARNLCAAFYDLLKTDEPGVKERRQNLFNAASKVGEASHAVLSGIGAADAIDKDIQDIMLVLAKILAIATANFILKTKNVASKCDNEAHQNKVINVAQQCALKISQLVVCAKIVAPTITNLTCQQQLIEADKEISGTVDGITKVCQEASREEGLLRNLNQASNEVEDALTDLQNHIRTVTKQKIKASNHDEILDAILFATDRLFSSSSDAREMVRQGKIIKRLTATLVLDMKLEGDSQTASGIQMRLLSAANVIADTTAKIEIAKGCESDSHNSASKTALQKAVENLKSEFHTAANYTLKRKLLQRLKYSAKLTATVSSLYITEFQEASPYNQNHKSREDLLESCEDVSRLVQCVKSSIMDVDNPSFQMALVSCCEMIIQSGNKIVSFSEAAMPSITDQTAVLKLNNTTKKMTNALAEFASSLMKFQETCGNMELENALNLIHNLDEKLLAFRKSAEKLELKPLPSETTENFAVQLDDISKVVGSSMEQLVTAASKGNENDIAIAARDTGSALKLLTKAVGSSTSTDRAVQTKIIDNARAVMDKSIQLIQIVSHRTLDNPSYSDIQQRLNKVAKSVSTALDNCVKCLLLK